MFNDSMFQIVPKFIGIVFALTLGIFLFVGIRFFQRWLDNNAQPVQTLPATVVTKRTKVWGGHNTSSSTSYFVTFQFNDGSRKEFQVRGHEFGMLAEDDRGELTFQGTRYKEFVRS